MTPNFALILSFEGLRLLHRASHGWILVGEVSLETADLAADLGELRSKAVALDPVGLATALVIPNEQIKYLSLPPVEGDPDAEVRQALDGATPYAVDELSFDWMRAADGQVQVAAVARETLTEAVEFAREHRFNPVQFTAMPDTGTFGGAPDFGQPIGAPVIAPDRSPIIIAGDAYLPTPADPAIPETSDITADAPPVEEPAVQEATINPIPAVDMPARDDATAQPDPEIAPEPVPDPQTAVDPAPAPVSFASTRDRPSHEVPAPAPTDPTPPAPSLGAATKAKVNSGATAPSLGAATAPSDTPRMAPAPSVPGDTAATRAASLRPDPADRRTAPDSESDAAAKPRMSFFSRRTAQPATAAASSGSVAVTTPPPKQRLPTSAADEAQRMTVFGARRKSGPKARAIGGKPRYLGIILTSALLLFLLGMAAWASIFLDDGLARFFRDQDPRSDIAAAPTVVPGPIIDMEPEAAEDGADLAAIPDTDTGSAADIETAVQEALNAPQPKALTPDEARARYAATGIWQMSPDAPTAPVASNLNDFYLTSIDRSVPTHDAVALPDSARARTDQRPDTPGAPAKAGTRFTLDERGFVVATPDGAVTPEGLRVFAGRPPVTPPRIPERAEAAPEPADLRLAAFRPRARPDGLIDANERSRLSGNTRAELAALRPRVRPQGLAPQVTVSAPAEPKPEETAAAIAPQEPATEPEEVPNPLAGGTPQAVSASLKPASRPRNFDRIVKRAEKTPEPTRVAAVAPRTVKPAAPSPTTVARAATDKNQINLRKINLIGVYGKPSSRRALVRLSNGRYKKVKVGDRLDGGRVAAIGDGELRYSKGSRNVVLKMPRG